MNIYNKKKIKTVFKMHTLSEIFDYCKKYPNLIISLNNFLIYDESECSFFPYLIKENYEIRKKGDYENIYYCFLIEESAKGVKQIIAMAQANKLVKKNSFYIDNVRILESHQGKGLCHVLMKSVLASIRKNFKGADIFLDVDKDNIAAVKCYERLGGIVHKKIKKQIKSKQKGLVQMSF